MKNLKYFTSLLSIILPILEIVSSIFKPLPFESSSVDIYNSFIIVLFILHLILGVLSILFMYSYRRWNGVLPGGYFLIVVGVIWKILGFGGIALIFLIVGGIKALITNHTFEDF